MITRIAKAEWNKTVKEGSGAFELENGAYKGQVTYSSRFENSAGTNPEELIGAAHASCFSMAFSLMLEKAGFPPEKISTQADVHLDEEQLAITAIDLKTTGSVAEITAEKFAEIANEAKVNCPVSKALQGVNISVEATLQ